MKKQQPKERVIFYVEKITMREYVLKELTLSADNKIISDEIIHRDLPVIICGKLIQKLRQKEINT